jgi:hypothetical protein
MVRAKAFEQCSFEDGSGLNIPVRDDARRFVAAIAIAVVFLLVAFAVWPRWSIYWGTSDKINFFVAAGTLALAASTVLLARYTLQSVRTSENIIAAENRRHEQSLAPILSARVVARDPVKHEITGIEVTNSGLGPALQIGITGNMQYERREYFDDGRSFKIIEKKSFEMMNCVGAVVGAMDSAILPTGAPPKWSLSADGTFCSGITIIYRDVFGTFYQSTGVDLWHGYFYWQPDAELFSPERRDAALHAYFGKQKKKKN